MFRRVFFWLRYLLGRAPWDTNITPPELVAVIEGEGLEPGRALDLGCGTGTNAVYLAQHGWHVTGVDFVPSAISQARRKAVGVGVNSATDFHVADVSKLDELGLPTYDFVLDIGCLHGLSPEQRRGYADGVSALTRPGATYLLYAFCPREARGGPVGLVREDVHHLFEPQFRVVRVEDGFNDAGEVTSAWYRLERVA